MKNPYDEPVLGEGQKRRKEQIGNAFSMLDRILFGNEWGEPLLPADSRQKSILKTNLEQACLWAKQCVNEEPSAS